MINKKTDIYFAIFLLDYLLLVVMKIHLLPPNNPTTGITIDVANDAYPSPIDEIQNGYPAPSVPNDDAPLSGYPAPTKKYDESKRFEISGPVTKDVQSVSGTGPANISIQIVSVSNVGETLGNGVINNAGTFNISLSRPLKQNETIAIMLADGSQRSLVSRCTGATDIPIAGIYPIHGICSSNFQD